MNRRLGAAACHSTIFTSMASKTGSALSAPEVDLVNRVHAHFPNNEPTRFHFFYTNQSPYSNFYPGQVTENGISFHCTEQYMMYHKARLFNDEESATRILQASTPGKCRALGRKVTPFDQHTWNNNRTRIVSEGNYLKFTQNENLKELLLAQGEILFVEASPGDAIWGVGLAESNPLISQRSTWRGLNLMGYLLTDIAFRLRDEDNST